MYLGLRVLTTALWAVAMTLLVVGSMATNERLALALYVWCIFVSSVALVGALWIIVDHLLTHESRRNAQNTADAVGAAVGAVLLQAERDGLRSVPTRRDI